MTSNKKKSSRQLANHEIRSPYVRLIGADGAQFGIIPTKEAREKATDSNLDLVCVSPNADPPVCKIIDLGKFKYAQKKKYKPEDVINFADKKLTMPPKSTWFDPKPLDGLVAFDFE